MGFLKRGAHKKNMRTLRRGMCPFALLSHRRSLPSALFVMVTAVRVNMSSLAKSTVLLSSTSFPCRFRRRCCLSSIPTVILPARTAIAICDCHFVSGIYIYPLIGNLVAKYSLFSAGAFAAAQTSSTVTGRRRAASPAPEIPPRSAARARLRACIASTKLINRTPYILRPKPKLKPGLKIRRGSPCSCSTS